MTVQSDASVFQETAQNHATRVLRFRLRLQSRHLPWESVQVTLRKKR